MRKKKKNKLTKEEKEIKEREGELPKKKIRNIQTKQAIWFIIVIIIFFLAFLIPYSYTQNQKVFNYAGVTWQVEKDGEITFYHTQFNKTFDGKFFGVHNTYFRNDPRNNPTQIDVTELAFFRHFIVSQSPEVLQCEKQILVTDALFQISQAIVFLTNKTTAVTDPSFALENNKEFINCENKPEKSTLIQIQLGDESKITEDREKKCYLITIKDCKDNLLVAEKLILEIIKQLNGL